MIVKFALLLCTILAVANAQEEDVNFLEDVVSNIFYNITDGNVLDLYNVTDDNNATTDKFTVDSSGGVVMKIHKQSPSPSSRIPNEETANPSEEESENSDLRWISYPLKEGLKDFVVQTDTNAECKRQVRLHQTHLRNQTVWAIRMQESTQSEMIGLLGGNSYQMGSYEECVNTLAYGIRGKYCLASLAYSLKPPYRAKYKSLIAAADYGDANQHSSVWEALEKYDKDPARIKRDKVHWGICMPSACSHKDLQTSLNDSLVPLFEKYNLMLNVTVDDVYCSTSEKLPYTTGFYITASFMWILLASNVLSTLCDGYDFLKGRYSHDTSGLREFVAAFSIFRNLYNLGVYRKESQVKIASAMKVLMMILIIYGHCLLYVLGYPHFHPEHLELVYRRGADIALVNTNIVDVFFTISGFISFYYGFHPMKIGGIIYLILSVLFRYLRLMPVFAIVIAYVTFILPYTSDGPIWKARILPEVENCYENWWLDLLLINNFKNISKQCVLISWYITDDMLLCMIASVLIYIIVKKPKLGLFVTFIVFITSIVITYSVTYANRYSGLLKLYMNFLIEPRHSVEFGDVYIALYSRAGPYLVGFLSAYLTIKLQERKYKFSSKMLIIGCILAIAIGEGSQYYGVVFYKYGRPYSAIENALYSSLHRILFATLFSWFLMVYLTTGLGIFDSIINHRVWTVFGRVTYSVFLMNTMSLITLAASMRTPWFASYKFILFIVLGDVVTTYSLGFLFYLYAEAPVCGISKLMQKSLAKMFQKEIEKAKEKASIEINGSSEKKPTV